MGSGKEIFDALLALKNAREAAEQQALTSLSAEESQLITQQRADDARRRADLKEAEMHAKAAPIKAKLTELLEVLDARSLLEQVKTLWRCGVIDDQPTFSINTAPPTPPTYTNREGFRFFKGDPPSLASLKLRYPVPCIEESTTAVEDKKSPIYSQYGDEGAQPTFMGYGQKRVQLGYKKSIRHVSMGVTIKLPTSHPDDRNPLPIVASTKGGDIPFSMSDITQTRKEIANLLAVQYTELPHPKAVVPYQILGVSQDLDLSSNAKSASLFRRLITR